jgi:hypothetical protein
MRPSPRPDRMRPLAVLGATWACAIALSACGDKPKTPPPEEGVPQAAASALDAIGQLAKAGAKMGSAATDAAKFQAERRARGDTVAMTYTALQAFLPDAPSGYKKAEEPGGSSQTVGALSMTEAEQQYVGPADANGTAPTLHVKLVDFGGTEGAYAMFAMPMMMTIKQEDAHHRMGTFSLGPQDTWASEELNKDTKDFWVTAITRYRYVITVRAEGQSRDESAMVRAMAVQLVKRFEGK